MHTGRWRPRRSWRKPSDALAPDGLLIVHDFWTDGPARGPVKSALFDLHMMVNTFQGRTYPWKWARDVLASRGLTVIGPVETEDTALVCAARDPEALEAVNWGWSGRLDAAARELGFVRTVALDPGAVVVAAWVAEKCRFGCSGYDRGAQCPPRSPGVADTRVVLASYHHALMVQGDASHGRVPPADARSGTDGIPGRTPSGAGFHGGAVSAVRRRASPTPAGSRARHALRWRRAASTCTRPPPRGGGSCDLSLRATNLPPTSASCWSTDDARAPDPGPLGRGPARRDRGAPGYGRWSPRLRARPATR